MFVFGVVVSSEEQLEKWALPGIRTAAGDHATVLIRRGADSIYTAYNSILEEAGQHDDLEGVVLIHQDLEIADPGTLDTLRARFADPEVAIVGVVGGVGVHAMGWWFGDGSFGAYGWDWLIDPEKEDMFDPASFWHAHTTRVHEVEAVDGMFIAMSPTAVRELRFDEDLAPGFHGYDADICFEARKAGMKVFTDEINVVHHNSADLPDRREFVRAHVAFARKWDL